MELLKEPTAPKYQLYTFDKCRKRRKKLNRESDKLMRKKEMKNFFSKVRKHLLEDFQRMNGY